MEDDRTTLDKPLRRASLQLLPGGDAAPPSTDPMLDRLRAAIHSIEAQVDSIEALNRVRTRARLTVVQVDRS